MATAWIIEWNRHREDSPITDLRPHILPYRWNSRRVMDYMRCLFWNSPLWAPFETVNRVNQREPLGIFILEEGGRYRYGDATHLEACLTRDLKIYRNKAGKTVMEWTAPPAVRLDRKTHTFVPIGKPTRRRFEESQVA